MKINQIKYLLGERGIKFVDIDRKFNLREGVSRFALSKPHRAGEEALALTLNIALKDLFPERYDERGRRLTPQPPINYSFKKLNKEGIENNA